MFDIIIPLGKKDVRFVHWTLHYIRKNLPEADSIYLLTAKRNFRRLTKPAAEYQCVLVDEDALVDGLTFHAVSSFFKANGHPSFLTGWYYQQFLKYAFALSGKATDYYLSWDGDTLPLSHIQFFDENTRPLFTLKKEFHKPYFTTLHNLLGIDKLRKESFIAEHMLFKTEFVTQLIAEIKRQHSDVPWWQAILMAIEVNGEGNYFSEFETYGNFCEKYHHGFYGTHTLNTFRCAGMIRGRHINEKLLSRLSIDLDIASFEDQDAPFPYNIPYLIRLNKTRVSKLLCAVRNKL